jgi:hypothetical protein
MVASANPKDSADYSTFTIAPPPDPCAHQEFSAPAHAHNVAYLDSAISTVLAALTLPAPFPSNRHRFDAYPSRISISTLRHSGISQMNNLTKRHSAAAYIRYATTSASAACSIALATGYRVVVG